MPLPFLFLDRILHWEGDISSLPADVSLFLPPSSRDAGGRAGRQTRMLHGGCTYARVPASQRELELDALSSLCRQGGPVPVALSRGHLG